MNNVPPPPPSRSNPSSGKMGSAGWAIFAGCFVGAITLAALVVHFFLPPKKTEVSPQFAGNLRQAMKDGMKKIDEKKPAESSQPLLQALDQEAKSHSPDAAAAGVMAQFSHEFQDCTNGVNTATQAAVAVPPPTDADPASYDKKIAADKAAIDVIQGEITFINNISNHIDDLARATKVPGLATDKMVLGFKSGVLRQQPLLIGFYTQMQRSFTTGSDIFSLLKTNRSHWHMNDKGHRLLDDAQAQQLYDGLVAANTAANQEMHKDQAQLAENQKQNLQQKF